MSRKSPTRKYSHHTFAKTAIKNAPRRSAHGSVPGRYVRGVDTGRQGPFVPPEDWHEFQHADSADFRIIVQDPGPGLRHAVTADQIRERLAELPEAMLRPLGAIQLSRMTRKKKRFPCYGLQWGNSLYLYPVPEDLIEYYSRPPIPAQQIEASMYGGRWEELPEGSWRLVWSEEAIQDYYLNNILIHELGHLLDDRNTSYAQREAYAEWFAIQHGYKASRRRAPKPRRVVRRHHAT